MAHLALPNSELRVGLDFAADPVVMAALAGDTPYVLFPGAEAQDLAALPRERPLTLIVVDGTWWQARKLLKLNPALAALPRVTFNPRRPSDYRIRRQPAAFCVSTIEALAEVLDALEPAGGPFERMLDPFRAMVDRQLQFMAEVREGRHRPAAAARRARRRPTLAMRLVEQWPSLVCVQGEANAWSLRDPARQDPEIVHWVAHRPATGETYETVVAPRRPLGPATPSHIELPAERLNAGQDVAAWHRSWREFSRPGDRLVQWGHFYRDLASVDGLPLPDETVDLRTEVTRMLRRRVGTMDECLATLGAEPPALGVSGRGGRRLAQLVGVVRALTKSVEHDGEFGG